MPPDAGPCKARMLYYYFDKEMKSCRTFMYGGCKGNENRFFRKRECENFCGGKLIYDDILVNSDNK